MPSKSKTVFVCFNCGYENPKWLGKCPDCGEWNSLQEEVKIPSTAQKFSAGIAEAVLLSSVSSDSLVRYKTGATELDRVLGGGIVPGSVVLLSGDPGIGKSTILLQACEYLGREKKVLYVSGEESLHQIKLRANRLNVGTSNLLILNETDTSKVCEFIKISKVDVAIIDSIQTMSIAEISSAPGSITQVRESANLLMKSAKQMNVPIILVGHVNKDGNIAGPKVLEHIVDTVLYFEGERNLSYRILRAVKNRFGSTNEIGVFEMCDRGLKEVENPSQMLISGRPVNTSGICIACVMEGSRPILAEIQGLVAESGFGTPRRMATGFDYNRMSLLIAVMEKRAGYFLGNCDCYINIVGGLRLDEPAIDLPVALALASSLKNSIIRDEVIAFGEIGLAGEIRAVNSCEQRIREAIRLGFSSCIIPKHNEKGLSSSVKDEIDIIGVSNIYEAVQAGVYE